MGRDDLAAALVIQAGSYPAFLQEGAEAFASRLTLSSSYCVAAVVGDTLVGYLLAHGWPGESPPPVGAILSDAGVNEALFIHDLAVTVSGQGIGRRLVDQAIGLADRNGLRRAELIAVEGAADYWRGLGFDDAACGAELAAKVAGYGHSARWMTRRWG